MGLDVYAGTLTRYYCRDWKTKAQRFAEENGMQFHLARPGEDEDPLSPAEVLEAVEAWRDAVAEGLSLATGESYPRWEEGGEKPYDTDKPDWDAFGALILYDACVQLKKPFPKTVRKGWDWRRHPLVERAMDSDDCSGSLLAGVELWLPFEQSFYFEYPDVCENPGFIGTVGGLLTELGHINEACWNADGETVSGWLLTEGYPAGRLAEGQKGAGEYDAQSLAKFAFAVLYRLAKFAADRQVPLKLDY